MLNLPKFLFINGPSGTGKTTLASMICKAVPSAFQESFAEPIRQMIYSVFFPFEDPTFCLGSSLDLRDGAVKRQPIPFIDAGRVPYTIREEMIAFSEDYMKRRYGPQIFGKLLFARCEEQSLFYSKFVIDDNGFAPEAEFIVEKEGAENCLLLRLHRTGCSFSGDSRGYVDLPGVRTIDLDNNDRLDQLLDSLQLKLGNI